MILYSILSCCLSSLLSHSYFLFFFFNHTATTEIYTLYTTLFRSRCKEYGTTVVGGVTPGKGGTTHEGFPVWNTDRKSTRLNSSHRCISYAVFCLKKKKNENECTIKYQNKRDRRQATVYVSMRHDS